MYNYIKFDNQTKKIQEIRIMDSSRQDMEFFQFRDLEKEIDKKNYDGQIKIILNYVIGHKYEDILLPNISDIYFLSKNSCNKLLGYIYVKKTKEDKQPNLIQLIEVVEGERKKGYGTYMINKYYDLCKCRCIPECIAPGSEQFWVKQFQEDGAYEYFDIHSRYSMEKYLKEQGFRYGDEIGRQWVDEPQEAKEVWKTLEDWVEAQEEEVYSYSDEE